MKTKKIKKNLRKYGWTIKTDDDQKYGSPSDIYVEYDHENEQKMHMMVDDGNCRGKDFCYHIYAGEANPGHVESKIFEGRIRTQKQFKTVMKVLGFKTLKKMGLI